MGKGSSKQLTRQHLQEQQVTEGANKSHEHKQANFSMKISKRNTYLRYQVQESPNVADETDPSKTYVEEDPPYATLENISTNDGKIQSNSDYENLRSQAREDVTTKEYENYPIRSHDEGRFQYPEGQINKTTDDTEYRLSTAYLNQKFLIEEGHIPARKKPDRPVDEALSIRRHYRELKRRVWLESVCDHFIQNGIFQDLDFENITHGSFPRKARVDILLQLMLQENSQKVFKAFNLALRNTGCKDLADELEKNRDAVCDKPYMRDWSENEILNSWPGIKEFLMDELQPEYILDFFLQENIFSVGEYEEVFWYMGRRLEMTNALLKTMKKNLPESLFVLLYALEEVDEENKHNVGELERVVTTGKYRQETSKIYDNQSIEVVYMVPGDETASSVTVPLSTSPFRTVRLSVEKEGKVMENVEIEIDKYMNNTDTTCLLEVFLPLTGCEITKSERGCVIIHLRPHSKHTLDKLSAFCKNGGLEKFVLNLLREEDIFSSLPGGELCINIQIQYHVGDLKDEDDEELETDLTTSIKDNWSYLCEELDVKALISGSLDQSVFTDKETTELEGSAAKDRYEVVAYFLACLLNKGQTGIQFLIDILKKTNNMKIINRLQKSDRLHLNPQTVKENLIDHFELIVQEIDPYQFKDTFVDRNIMDRKFFTDLREKHRRRRCRAALFLREVLNKGNRAIYAFMDVIADIGYEDLLAKLVSLEQDLFVSKPKKDDGKEGIVTNNPAQKGWVWSSCMKINVEKNEKDETKQQVSGSSSEKEEPLYMNLPWDDQDEGTGGAEDKSPVTLSS